MRFTPETQVYGIYGMMQSDSIVYKSFLVPMIGALVTVRFQSQDNTAAYGWLILISVFCR